MASYAAILVTALVASDETVMIYDNVNECVKHVRPDSEDELLQALGASADYEACAPLAREADAQAIRI